MTNYEIEFNPVFKRDHIVNEMPRGFIPMFSGKSAIAAVMQYLRKEGILQGKSDQVLVPQWMGNWVYMTIQKYAMTTPVYTPQTKVIFVYHQWGFPQDMDKIMNFAEDKKLVVIEDCAHALRGFYKSKRLGEFGLAGVYSFSKFFDCIVGGGLNVGNIQLKFFVHNLQERSHSEQLAEQIVKQRRVYDECRTRPWIIDQHYAVYDQVYKMPQLSRDLINAQLADRVLEKRKRIYDIYKSHLFAWKDSNTIPWAVPVLINKGMQVDVVQKLEGEGIQSGVYYFDTRQNLLNPLFQEWILLPCHHHMTNNDVDKVIEIVKGRLK